MAHSEQIADNKEVGTWIKYVGIQKGKVANMDTIGEYPVRALYANGHQLHSKCIGKSLVYGLNNGQSIEVSLC